MQVSQCFTNVTTVIVLFNQFVFAKYKYPVGVACAQDSTSWVLVVVCVCAYWHLLSVCVLMGPIRHGGGRSQKLSRGEERKSGRTSATLRLSCSRRNSLSLSIRCSRGNCRQVWKQLCKVRLRRTHMYTQAERRGTLKDRQWKANTQESHRDMYCCSRNLLKIQKAVWGEA